MLEEIDSKQRKWQQESLKILQKLKTFQDSVQEMMAHSKCPICMEYYNYPATIGCGHTFCMECINQWKEVNCTNEDSKLICPVCRYLNSNFIFKNPMVCEIVAQLKKLATMTTCTM